MFPISRQARPPSRTRFRRRLHRRVLVLAMMLCGATVAAHDLSSGVGLTDPTLAFNLTPVSDWSTEMPFLDIARTMRPWIGFEGWTWGAMNYQQLADGGYLDDHGWLTHMPDGVDAVGTIWAWGGADQADTTAAESRTGVYVLTYEGEGTIDMTLGAHVLSSEPGQIVFENTTGTQMGLKITATDPNGNGNYIHDISVVPQKYEALYQAGEIFNPDWLSVIDDSRELRFMDWMDTNNSTLSAWADRPQLGDATWNKQGVPVEVMVQLANQTGADPWFNMPAQASDEYIRNFATYVRDHLDPSLTAHVEYSNETWNPSFAAFHWLSDQSMAEWGVDAAFDYSAKRATETALIWDQVYGDQASSRVENILATQTGNPWVANRLLTAPIWASHEPGSYMAPASVFDALAITNYFGGADVSDPQLRAALIDAIQDPTIDASAYLMSSLLNPDVKWSLPYTKDMWEKNKAIADQYGLNLVAYEGGQHVHHSAFISGLSSDDLATLTDFLTKFVRSPAMAQLYQQLWDAWAQVSDGPFMQFGDVAAPSKYGSWGLLSDLNDSNPRADLLQHLNATSSSWFGDGGGTRYQQGVIHMGGDGGQLLTGTQKIDFLVGGKGNDTFHAGAGNDGINGGAGNDMLLLSGSPSQYRLTAHGKGYDLAGPDGTDYIVNVETLQFGGGVTKAVAEMAKG